MTEWNDDKLRELFRAAGPHTTPAGLHEAVMQRVLQTTVDPLPAEKPLISVRAWLIMGLVVATLLVLAAIAPSGLGHPSSALPGIPLTSFLDHLGSFDLTYLYRAVPITVSLFALTLLDRVLAHGRLRSAH